MTRVAVACWAGWAVSGVLAIAIAPACSTFGEDATVAAEAGAPDAGGDGGPAACPEACTMAVPFCQSWDFTDGCPPAPEFMGAGDTDRDNAFHGCNNGRVRVVAKGTLDHTITLSTKTPPQPYRAHVAATATLAEWSGDKGRDVIAVLDQSGTLAVIRAVSATKTLIYSFCVGPDDKNLVCAAKTESAPKGTAHRLAVDIAADGRVGFSFDCKEVTSASAQIRLTPQSTIKLRFGDTDGDPIDGQLDDVIIALPLL